jgi:hypothetical protein
MLPVPHRRKNFVCRLLQKVAFPEVRDEVFQRAIPIASISSLSRKRPAKTPSLQKHERRRGVFWRKQMGVNGDVDILTPEIRGLMRRTT